MTFSIPEVDQLGWGEPLRKHLAQLNDPDKGGFTVVQNDTERDSKFWPNGSTTRDEFVGKTIYNHQTGTFQVWTVSGSSRIWLDLQKLMTPVIRTGIGKVKTEGNKLLWDGTSPSTQFTLELEVGDIITIGSQTKSVTEVVSDTEVKLNTWFNKTVDIGLKGYINLASTSLNITAGTASVVKVGDTVQMIWPPSGIGQTFTVASISGNQITTVEPSSYNYGTAGSPLFVYVAAAIPPNSTFSYTKEIVNLIVKREADRFLEKGLAVNAKGDTLINQASLANSFTNDFNDTFISSGIYANYVANEDNWTHAGFPIGIGTKTYVASGKTLARAWGSAYSFLRTPRSEIEASKGRFNDNGGKVDQNIGMYVLSGHAPSLPTTTTTTDCVGIYNEMRWSSGTFDRLIGMQIASSSYTGGTFNHMWGIYEDINPIETQGKAKNYFRNRVGIGIDIPSQMLQVAGNITATGTITPGSDIRWKKDINQLEGALTKISELKGVTYNWKDKDKGEDREIGLIAQDVEKVFPEAIKKDNDGYMSVNYNGLVGALVEAIKEQQLMINDLKLEITELKNKLI